MDRIVIAAIILIVSWIAMAYLGWTLSRQWNKPKIDDFGTAGSLIVCTDDPDGPYIFFESGIPIDELLKHDTVKLSVREFTSQK